MTTVGSRPAPTAPGRHAPLRGPRGPAFALADQVLSSASNFLLGVIVARAGGAEALGTFGVAFLVWLAVLGTSRALISEPMTVAGEPDASRTELGEGLAGSVLVGVAAAAVLGVAGLVLVLTGVGAGGLLALAPWLPSLLAQDYCRGAAFRVGRPDHALASDAAFFLVQAAVTVAVFATGVANLTCLLAAWGVGATVGMVVAMYLSRVRVVVAGPVARLRALWPRSRWFVAEFATAFPADQGYLLLLPLLLSTAEFGMYRAGASLVGPVVVLFVAGGNVGLPSAVRSLRDGGVAGLARFAPRLTAAVSGATIVYCGLAALLAEPLLPLAYGADFAQATTVTRVVALQYVIYSLSFGWGVATKAADRMRRLWGVRLVSVVVSVAAVVLFTRDWGTTGAAFAGVATACVYSAGVVLAFRSVRRGGAHPRRR